jgi:hypothetical protein
VQCDKNQKEFHISDFYGTEVIMVRN